MGNLIEKINNLITTQESLGDVPTFQTEVDLRANEEFSVKDHEVVIITTFRAHWSSIIAMSVDLHLNPAVLTTSSLESEVFIWDLNSKIRKGENSELIQVGSLVIKGNNKGWNIVPDREQKLKRQRVTKNEILSEALEIRARVNKEYSRFNKVREYEESGILDEVNRTLEMKMREKQIDLRFLMHLQPEEE